MKKHTNIPVFIPHFGCPNDCVFCNQRKISGVKCYDPDEVKNVIDAALSTAGNDAEDRQIAFFGGSFTGIPRYEMLYLLDLAKEYIGRGLVSSVRLSTRPDYIDGEILSILRSHGVGTVELGIQSASDEVLSACRRGHTRADSERAMKAVVEYGFELVGQMMTGLPRSTPETELETAKLIADCGASAARIYPTVVFTDTALYGMVRSGEYVPLTEDEHVSRAASVLEYFDSRGIKVIRIGLQAGEALINRDGVFGCYDESVGEKCYGRFYGKRITDLLAGRNISGKRVVIRVKPGEASRAAGYRGANKKMLENRGASSVSIYEGADTLAVEII